MGTILQSIFRRNAFNWIGVASSSLWFPESCTYQYAASRSRTLEVAGTPSCELRPLDESPLRSPEKTPDCFSEAMLIDATDTASAESTAKPGTPQVERTCWKHEPTNLTSCKRVGFVV